MELCCAPLQISNTGLHIQLPKLLELVGLGYTSWFTYRYLLFKVRTMQMLPLWLIRPTPS